VTDEASALLGGRPTALLRYEGDAAVAVAIRGSPAPPGSRVPAADGTPTGQVQRTGRPLRVDSLEGTALADLARELGVASGVAVPITVGGRVRAALVVGSAGPPLPADTGACLARLAELAAVAMADAETGARLAASRARIVADADESRRRLQRTIHDGPQQRLVHAVITLRMARDAIGAGSVAAALVEEALTHVERAGHQLRDVVHGILPRSLTHGGLHVALGSLLADLPLPVDARIAVPRLPAAVETTAYLVVAEVLTNAVEHARARRMGVDVGLDAEVLVVEVRDDGGGGADPARGTGLTGLVDRVEAVGGSMTIVSPQGVGTTVHVELPARPAGDRTPAGGSAPPPPLDRPPVGAASGV
jgi:signal transduction histidine kinase